MLRGSSRCTGSGCEDSPRSISDQGSRLHGHVAWVPSFSSRALKPAFSAFRTISSPLRLSTAGAASSRTVGFPNQKQRRSPRPLELPRSFFRHYGFLYHSELEIVALRRSREENSGTSVKSAMRINFPLGLFTDHVTAPNRKTRAEMTQNWTRHGLSNVGTSLA